ncbi:pilus assembly protein [Rhizobium sp. BK251]|uniref:pilus assembly protein n=1 Tax=Rhizobium sp. BK251 TaxID=2512125 RepID=UPI00104DA4AD|nr:pilus assembly protein [Rhizobium sp. BK251]
MSTQSTTSSSIRRLLHDRGGNFGIMTAILLPVLLGGAGVAIDISNVALSQRQLQESSDAAALAAATALGNGTATDSAKSLAKDLVSGQMAEYLSGNPTAASHIKDATSVVVTTTSNGSNSTTYDVKVNTSYDMPLTAFMRILGYNSMTIGASSSTKNVKGAGSEETRSALSMMLALDESGSMADDTETVASQTCISKKRNGDCKQWQTTYVSKIAALKTAAAALFDMLDKADPEAGLVRTGAVSYTHLVKGQTSPTMSWGTTTARKYVTGMPSSPAGGTDASGAMTIADAAVKKATDGKDTETVEHGKKGNKSAERYIVLMTDGQMTGNSNQWNQTIDTKVKNLCQTAKGDGIKIFSVAFMAPDKGKQLLRDCASGPDNYYEPNTMDNLVNAFKHIGETVDKSITRLTQ